MVGSRGGRHGRSRTRGGRARRPFGGRVGAPARGRALRPGDPRRGRRGRAPQHHPVPGARARTARAGARRRPGHHDLRVPGAQRAGRALQGDGRLRHQRRQHDQARELPARRHLLRHPVLRRRRGPPEGASLALALEELAFFSVHLRILGTYPASPFRAEIAEPPANRLLRPGHTPWGFGADRTGRPAGGDRRARLVRPWPPGRVTGSQPGYRRFMGSADHPPRLHRAARIEDTVRASLNRAVVRRGWQPAGPALRRLRDHGLDGAAGCRGEGGGDAGGRWVRLLGRVLLAPPAPAGSTWPPSAAGAASSPRPRRAYAWGSRCRGERHEVVSGRDGYLDLVLPAALPRRPRGGPADG